MLGFALQTAHDNKWGSVLAVGIGTSMLQFKNIVKKPVIWLPTIIASACLGPLAMLLPLDALGENVASGLSVGAGMGTCAFVGQLNFFDAFSYRWDVVLELLGMTVVTPLILVFLIDWLFRKCRWIQKGDFSLSNEI